MSETGGPSLGWLAGLAAALLVGTVLVGPPGLVEESAADHQSTDFAFNATVTTANCSVDDGGLCQRTDTLNASEFNAGAGGNDDPAIRAEMYIEQRAGPVQAQTDDDELVVRGYGTGFQTEGDADADGFEADGAASYVSVMYLNPDEARCTPGLDSQGPGGEQAEPFVLGVWDVDEDGTATLNVTHEEPPTGVEDRTDSTDHDGLVDYNTVSIRRVGFNATAFQQAQEALGEDFDGDLATKQLRACGGLQPADPGALPAILRGGTS